jgi:formyltetrahydrofolate deformylase
MEPYILLIICKDRKGLIYNIAKILFQHNLNIVSNGEFVEKETNTFFMRTEFAGPVHKEAIIKELRVVLPACAVIQLVRKRKKDIIILATKESHCLGDLLIRYYSNELNVNILSIISNHSSLKELSEKFNINFHHIGHEVKSREEHEKELMNTISAYNPEYLVLAKYMRILSKRFISEFPNRIINIHHSFLPAFVGAKPYEKAYKRGVKIIGATAHFVDESLDEGPIIAQNVIPVSHSHNANDMAQAGRDVEKIVLAKALKLVLEERVFVSGNKTVIFD